MEVGWTGVTAGSAGTRLPRVLPAGRDAVLLEVVPSGDALADAAAVAGLADRVRAALRDAGRPPVDVVPGAVTVLVDGVGPADHGLLTGLLIRLPAPPRSPDPGPGPDPDGAVDLNHALGSAAPVLELPTVYDGPDLADVAARWGVSVGEAVARHAGLVFQAAFTGFAPGFAYLAGLPAEWVVPRRGESRAAVPAGAVGLAGPWCGVYPRVSPGGWQLLGRTAPDVTRRLFDPAAVPPALLGPGVRVRFVPVG